MDEREQFEKVGLESLERIEKDLEGLKSNPKRTFLYGMLYGAGAFIGGILALMLLGWLLSVAGFIPGFADIVERLNALIEARTR